MMKKLFVCMLAVTLLLIGLVACGKKNNSTTTTTTAKPSSSSSLSSTTTTTTAATTTTSRFLTLTFTDSSGEIIDAYTIVRGETVEAPKAPTVSGKNFTGYFDENGAKYDATFPYQTSTTFKAKYANVPYYTVTFTGEGINTFYRRITPGTTPYILPDAPVRYGYIFDGWYNNGTPHDFNSEIREDITLVAKWISGWVVTFVDEQNNVISETTARDGCGVSLPAGTSSYCYVPIESTALLNITEDTTITLKKVNYPGGSYQTSLGMNQSSNYTRYFSTTGRVYSYATTLGADQYVTFTGKFVGGVTFYIGGEKIGKDQSMTVEVLLDGEVVNRLTFSTTAREYLTVAATETYGTHTVTIRVVETENISSSGGTGISVLISECRYRTK